MFTKSLKIPNIQSSLSRSTFQYLFKKSQKFLHTCTISTKFPSQSLQISLKQKEKKNCCTISTVSYLNMHVHFVT